MAIVPNNSRVLAMRGGAVLIRWHDENSILSIDVGESEGRPIIATSSSDTYVRVR